MTVTTVALSVDAKPQPSGASASARPFLSLSGLTKRYGTTTVVQDASLDVMRGELLCILGPSGCGKTTLLRLIAGFETADAGSIRQDGQEISANPPEARDFGIVFQSYALFPEPHRRRAMSGYGLGQPAQCRRGDRASGVRELLDAGRPARGTRQKYPSPAVRGPAAARRPSARARDLSPGLLLLDEPLSALDANVRASLRDELQGAAAASSASPASWSRTTSRRPCPWPTASW